MKLLLGFLLALMVAAPASAQLSETQAGPVTIAVDRIELVVVGFDRMDISIDSHVTSTRKIKVKQIRFEGMHLGELPIHPAPLTRSMILEKGQTVTLPPIPVTIYFKDLPSMKPLEDIVLTEQATVEGEIQADLDLNFFERLFGGQLLTHTVLPFRMTIPFRIPGGAPARLAAIAALQAAQLLLTVGGFR